MKFLKLIPVAFVVFLASCAPDTSDPVYPKATNLYFADFSGKQVGKMDINTTNIYTPVATNGTHGLDNVTSIAIDFIAGKIYATEEINNRVVRFNIDGSGTVEELFTASDGVKNPTAIALDPETDTVYWANSGTGKFLKGHRTGGTPKTATFTADSIISNCYGFVIDRKNDVVFFSNLQASEAGNCIYWARIDEEDVYPLMSIYSMNGTILRNPSSLAFDPDNERLYWADEGLGVIGVASLTIQSSIVYNQVPALLYDDEDGVERADGIAIDRGNMFVYWSETNADNHVIKRAAIDGMGEPETILEDVESYSLQLEFPVKK